MKSAWFQKFDRGMAWVGFLLAMCAVGLLANSDRLEDWQRLFLAGCLALHVLSSFLFRLGTFLRELKPWD